MVSAGRKVEVQVELAAAVALVAAGVTAEAVACGEEGKAAQVAEEEEMAAPGVMAEVEDWERGCLAREVGMALEEGRAD